MFQNLGRLLTGYCFPRHARSAAPWRRACDAPRWPQAWARDSRVIVLGLSFEDLGLGIAKGWACPTPCSAAYAARQRTASGAGKGARAAALLTLAANEIHRHAAAREGRPTARLAISPSAMRALGLSVRIQSPPSRRVIASRTGSPGDEACRCAEFAGAAPARHRGGRAPPSATDADARATHAEPPVAAFEATRIEAPPASMPPRCWPRHRRHHQLSMVGASNSASAAHDPRDRVPASGFRRIVFCHDRDRDAHQPFGLGEGRAVANTVQVPLRAVPTCSRWSAPKGADTLISDATVANIETKLPPWYPAARARRPSAAAADAEGAPSR